MTVINSSRIRRPNGHELHPSASVTARLLLIVACIWPILLFLFFGTTTTTDHLRNSTAGYYESDTVTSPRISTNIALKFRDVLDRVDIMGYGPTHPRVAVVIVGDNKDNLVLTLESVFAYTDVSRIFLAVVVGDGIADDPALTQTLKKIDNGDIPHWHGSKPTIHVHAQGENDDPHGQKVHVMYNEVRRGLAESRKDALDFIQILENHHLESGLKSEAEDLILLLLQSGAQLTVSIVTFIF
jgi:hypothetical protein